MKSNEYDISLIRKYLNGELDARSMYKLERQAQDDPLLMDLILGMESGDQKEHEDAIRHIDEMVRQRTITQKRSVVPLFRWRVAASFLLLCGITAWFVMNTETPVRISSVKRKTASPQVKQLPVVSKAETVRVSTPSELLANTSKQQPVKTRVIVDRWPKLVKEEQKVAMLKEAKANDSTRVNQTHITEYNSLAASNPALTVLPPLPAPDNNVQQALQGRLAGVSVMKSVKKDRKQHTVAGVVVDKDDNSAIPGVLISVRGSGQQAVTDKEGRFKITMPDKSDSLELNYIGFQRKSIKVANRDSVTIAMAPSDQSLNEVVVVGYGAQNRRDNEEAEALDGDVRPLEGWRNFHKYLKDHAVAEKGVMGIVTVSFNVSSDGQLSDFSIIMSTNEVLNDRAVKLIKEGPQWQGLKNGTKKVKLRVRFIDRQD